MKEEFGTVEIIDMPPLEEVAKAFKEAVDSQTHESLLKSLYWVYDFMDRALIDFFVVGKTADAVKNTKELYGDKLTVAVRKSAWESGSRRIADSFATPLTETPEVVTYEYEGVPITLYVLEDNDAISSLDQKIYHSEFFKLPNPYELFVEKYQWLN